MATAENAAKGKYVVSLLFDKRLMELGEWPHRIYSELEEWNELSDYEAQRVRAAFLISSLVLRFLGNDCSSKGKMRARRLGRDLASFEQIIISTRGLERKFYRDHLNHVIRVALLARAIGRRSPFDLSAKDLNSLVLVSLFHDVAYPLSEISQSIKFSTKAIKACYEIASKALLSPDIGFNLSILSSLPFRLHEQKKKLEALDHGILSALEFISYLQPRSEVIRKYAQTVQAIALHNSSGTKSIDSFHKRILSLLILADELQDWGRPIGNAVGFSFIPKIEEFKLEDSKLKGRYNTRSINGYSTLRQIRAKALSLKRVRLPESFDFTLKFSFDHFKDLPMREIETSLQMLYDKCNDLEKSLFKPSNFDKLYEEGSVFEKEYYGKPIPRKIKLELLKLLNIDKLPSKSMFRDRQLFFNEDVKELLVSNVRMRSITHFQFQSLSGGIRLQSVTRSAGTFCGEMEWINDPDVFELAMFLLSEVRFLNICVQKIAKFRAKKYPVHIGFEGFPESKDISKAMKETNNIKLPEHLELLAKLRDCISSDGIFLFKSYLC